eukprot:1316906-Alexandrium_andersonii.AAC.1
MDSNTSLGCGGRDCGSGRMFGLSLVALAPLLVLGGAEVGLLLLLGGPSSLIARPVHRAGCGAVRPARLARARARRPALGGLAA